MAPAAAVPEDKAGEKCEREGGGWLNVASGRGTAAQAGVGLQEDKEQRIVFWSQIIGIWSVEWCLK